MSLDQNIKNPLQREGTGRSGRASKALDPSYAKIDERSVEDFLSFAEKFAEQIQYYNAGNQHQGNWKDFFEKPGNSTWEHYFQDQADKNKPHLALFRAFLSLFGFAQDHTNTLTEKHLTYYYKDILKLSENTSVSDKVHVLIELAKNIDVHLLKEGTLLSAGKNQNGKELLYKLTKEIAVNQAVVSDIKSVFSDTANSEGRIYSAPKADSADGTGKEFEGDDTKWHPFGENQAKKTPANRTMQDAQIGFALASPVLNLKEGNRTVTLTLYLKKLPKPENEDDPQPKPLDDIEAADFKETFKIHFTGEKEWIGPFITIQDDIILDKDNEVQNIQLKITVPTDLPAITAYNPEFHGGKLNTNHPALKLMLNTETEEYKYAKLKHLIIDSAKIQADVTGVNSLTLQNDYAVLDPAKPFEPFGSVPVLGSSFYIGSAEVFSKKLDKLSINIDWHSVPESLKQHYLEYVNLLDNNESFEAEVSLLKGKEWKSLFLNGNDPIQQRLFEANAKDSRVIIKNEALKNERLRDLKKLNPYDHTTQNGFIKFELTAPYITDKFQAFGHKEYSKIYTQKVADKLADPNNPDIKLPNEPYTPTVKSVSLDYSSSETLVFKPENVEGRIEQFYHIDIFGDAELYAKTSSDQPYLLPQYNDEGTLYLGINNLKPPQSLSILFQVAEGSADPLLKIEQDDIKWSYLSDNQWVKFDVLRILTDTTNGFKKNGIISIDIPETAADNNTVMPAGPRWIKASVKKDSGGTNQLIDIKTQAVTAEFVDNENNPDHLKESLPAQSITKLTVKEGAVKKILQPFASFGGKPFEQNQEFFTRVSERLRHKGRGIEVWDYEHMVLEKFPAVYQVKCLNHTNQNSELAPGHVTLIAIPNLKNKNAVNPLAPKAGIDLLADIEAYLGNYISPFVKFKAENPTYEQLLVGFKAGFHQGYDEGLYGQILNDDLVKFLSPWAYEEGQNIVFGSKIHKSAIMHFIEERPYVDFVNEFVLYHIFNDKFPDYIGYKAKNIASDNEEMTTEYGIIPAANTDVYADFLVNIDKTDPNDIDDDIIDDDEDKKYQKQLEKDINNFFKTVEKLQSGLKAQRPVLKAYIEGLPYVNYIENLRLFYKIDENTVMQDVEVAEATSSKSILVSTPVHSISVLKAGDYTCEGLENLGIGFMTITLDFIVS